MKTGEGVNFVQQFVLGRSSKRQWRWKDALCGLEEIFPAISEARGKIDKESCKTQFVSTPMLAVAVMMFFEQVREDLRRRKIVGGISDLRGVPFPAAKEGVRYALFVVDGKLIVFAGHLADINCHEDCDVTIGLVDKVVCWGPEKEAKKLMDKFITFVLGVGYVGLKVRAIKFLNANKRMRGHLPAAIKKFYHLSG